MGLLRAEARVMQALAVYEADYLVTTQDLTADIAKIFEEEKAADD